jgi:hypothetical protein
MTAERRCDFRQIGHDLTAPLLHAEGTDTGFTGRRTIGCRRRPGSADWSWPGSCAARLNILLRDDDEVGGTVDRQLEKKLVEWRVARQLARFLSHRLDDPPVRILMTGPTGSGKPS